MLKNPQKHDSIKPSLILECFYSSGIEPDEDYFSSCVNMSFDDKNIDDFLFFFVKELS